MEQIPGFAFISEENPPSPEGCPKGGVANSHPFTKINNIPIFKNFVENLPYNPSLAKLSKDKRKEGILSEILF